MESDLRYFERRANAEMLAAGRALTAAARQRRLELAAGYQAKLAALRR